MPLYEYIDEDTGETVELFLHHDECDDIGQIRREGDRRLRRIFSQVATNIDNGFVSRQVHKWHPDVKNHTKDGWAAFNNRREAREFIARNNGRGNSATDWSLDD